MKLLLLIGLLSLNTASSPGDAILGQWKTENDDATVQIVKSNGKYQGKIIALKVPNYPDGTPRRDSRNPNKSLRTRSLVGLLVFWDMEYAASDKKWVNGRIYSPEMGKEVSGSITLTYQNTLKIRGYLGFELLGQSQTWKRVK